MTALSYKPFAIYFVSNSLSLLGLWMQKVSIGWLAWNLTESTFWTSFVALSLMAPAGILGPFFGVWAEKWDMRKATIILKFSMFFISIVIFYLQFIQAHSIFSLAVLTLIAIAGGFVMEKYKIFGGMSKYFQALCYTSTLLFHMLPAITDFLRRLPIGDPFIESFFSAERFR